METRLPRPRKSPPGALQGFLPNHLLPSQPPSLRKLPPSRKQPKERRARILPRMETPRQSRRKRPKPQQTPNEKPSNCLILLCTW
ncbi:non-histone chromosomal protein HMG-17 isoform X1 [Neoarius graeffei]|uniref:non-histone chromosomal protein HMG-17 isoform X1 n=1 Tax=Neoarius graeffei TaxID=443677 RepID=UPI00298BDD96|nr:non-histone chromosomal protein HMG-17 isoform X1 [Neoarius graeffei]XP_060756323.1 non-histone chromosomal protein HMG-17 isoform X1 [Neoarius graeffei]